MTALKKIWNIGWRAAAGALLLVWIFHSIFVNEARTQAARIAKLQQKVIKQTITSEEQAELARSPARLANEWTKLSRTAQWQLGWTYGPPALWEALCSVNVGALALSFILMGGTLVIGVARWRMVLRVQGLALPLARAVEISLVAHFFNSFLLGTAGGDVMKAYCAARETHHKKTEAVVTVFVDRVIGLWAMLLFATLMIAPNFVLFLQPGLRTAAASVVAMTIAASGFVFLAFRGGVSKRWSGARALLRRLPKAAVIERSLDSCREFGRERGFLRRTLTLSMLLNLLCVLQFFVLALGLHMPVSFLALCLIVPTVICISAVPIFPGGLGLRENLVVQLLAAPAIAVTATPALSLSLLAFAGSLFWSLVGGVVYAMFKHKHHLSKDELETTTDGHG